MAGLSLLQGLLLWLLWHAAADQTWPTTVPVAAFPLWTVALVWPTLVLFCLERGNAARVVTASSAVTAVLAPLAVHVGWQASSYGAFPVESLPIPQVGARRPGILGAGGLSTGTVRSSR